MNTTEKTSKIKAPKWMRGPEESVMTMTSEIVSRDHSPEAIANVLAMNAISDSEEPSSYVPELEEDDEVDIIQIHTDAGSTNEFIAESYHEIAKMATRTTTIGY